MKTYNWEEIMKQIKTFARVEDISDIILLGDKKGKGVGIRRIKFEDEII